jgi:hypothetical protein
VGYGEEVEGDEAQQPCERYILALDPSNDHAAGVKR